MPEQTATAASDQWSATSETAGAGSGNAQVPTDEEILGITEEAEASDQQPAPIPSGPATGDQEQAWAEPASGGQATKAAAKTQPQATEPKPQEEGLLSPGGAAPPAWLKQLYADPKFGKEAQRLWDTSAAYREAFSTVAEARAVKELFPGGAEEARAVHAKANALDEADEQFVSGDPEAQTQLATEWYEDNPEAFTRMVSVSAKLLAAREPETYQHLTSQIFLGTLQRENFDKRVELLREALEKNDAEALKALVGNLVGWAQQKGIAGDPAKAGAISPERQVLERERQELIRQRQELEARTYQGFEQAAQTAVQSSIQQSIEGTLANVLKDAPFTEAGRKRIAEEVFRTVDEKLRQDKGLTRQYAAIVRPGGRSWRLDEAAKTQVVNLLAGRAKALIPAVAKQVVADYTAYVLSANKEVIGRKESAARRVDIAGGGAPQTRVRPLTQEDIRGMSDLDVLNL